MRAYQNRLTEIQSLGGAVIAISPQLPDKSRATEEKDEVQFAVLSDVGQSVARQFGLVFPVADVLRPIYKNIGVDLPAYNGNESWELPIPGTFVVAKDGTIALAFVDADYTHRLEPEVIVQCLRTLAKS